MKVLFGTNFRESASSPSPFYLILYFLTTLSDKNSSDKIVETLTWCRKFCSTKNFVRRKFYPIFQCKSQEKIGQNCRNFGLVSKILPVEIFCPIRYSIFLIPPSWIETTHSVLCLSLSSP